LLLADIVSMLGVTRQQFVSTHERTAVHRIAWADFEMQTMFADFKSIRRRVEQMLTNDEHAEEHRGRNVETMSGSDFSDEDCIEVVGASLDLFSILGIEVIPLR